ncbi:LOW QUALITY PROTEIN: Hypothetical protein PHPALM_14269 [Phytophthora palmivora]|uniref:PiggyBac transposable element-derived protein domain-containing protein n=1 Tax=Phytophthora palmivora TaxID=4796 RepID=A0A2P4XV45_9STRA|nr:LOW QUALITY PROTEIN: Hypothetical protein PHPALM_14269 [Phytophthora palmivora]
MKELDGNKMLLSLGPTQNTLDCTMDHLARRSIRYHRQNIGPRAREIQRNERRTYPDIQKQLRNVYPVESREILRVIGLLIARMLAPETRGLAARWSRSLHGAVPLGTFGPWLVRNRCGLLRVDGGWKVRSIVTALQKTYARGYDFGPVIAFDEAIIPTHATQQDNTYQKTRKGGAKFFSACCEEAAYCIRIELYVGTNTNISTSTPADNSPGAAAVMQSLNTLLQPSPKSSFRLVVTDSFYTSVVLALDLHSQHVWSGWFL